jgi:iron complex outermembrane receptor protein
MFQPSKISKGKGRLLLGTAAAVLSLATSQAMAQQGVLMEEIIVTAQKREQSAQKVGIAITTFSGKQLQALGYTNAQEVTALAPGVSMMQPNGEANYSIGIRGVANNDFTTNVESPVAIYVDEVYISQMSGAGFLLFDMDRVEVLRGPQGTLFGRNATGGLVHYVTVKPSQEFNGYGSVTYGSFNRLKFQGAVNVPVANKVSARISVATHQGDGYVLNRLKPQSKLNNARYYLNVSR